MTSTGNASRASTPDLKRPSARVAFVLGSFLVGFVIAFNLLDHQIDSQVFDYGKRPTAQPALNIWFDSNAPLVYLAMTNTQTRMQMTNRHPLFPYIGVLPVKAMRRLGIPEPLGVCLVLAFGVGLMSGLFALTLTLTLENAALMGLGQLFFLASASFVFWSGLCERFSWGSATILSVTAGAAYYSRKEKMPLAAAVFLNVISLSVTITNWMFGLLLALNFFKIKTAIKVGLYGLAAGLGLWFMEQLFITQHDSLLHVQAWNHKYVLNDYAGAVHQKLVALLGHTAVMPGFHLYGFADGVAAESHQMLGVAQSAPGSSGPLGLGLVIAWAVLLVVGTLAWSSNVSKSQFDRFLSFGILCQITLHMIYGVELFLYGLHVLPLVLLLVMRGVDTLKGPSRRIVIAGLCGFVPLLAFHNINQYGEARTLYVERYEERLHSPAEAPAHGAQQGPQQGRQQKPQ